MKVEFLRAMDNEMKSYKNRSAQKRTEQGQGEDIANSGTVSIQYFIKMPL